ncbi:TonB-dependent receptor [Pedobacter sandarakinus]|uniref:TonB-dependent receptor n=1 Tax=Pedobacter sandarakinus TaxID=353156 RepID=UPI0022476B05|nr:TonB-dependent receptor [Pedobacter sandarakinus]MCX2574109.1 TonB-dependent receptor [Pedobacter sandarakinus]
MKNFLTLSFFILLNAFSYGQVVLTGKVVDKAGQPIIGASIVVKGTKDGGSSGTLGYYRFSSPAKAKRILLCKAIGYVDDSVHVQLTGDSIKTDFLLGDKDNNLSGVSINLRKIRVTDIKKGAALNAFEVATTAGAVADVVGALQTLPGAAPAGNETGLFVRGGSSNETKAFFDGMLVKNPFGSRLPDVATRSRFSAFLFKETAFTTSGYSAKYGQALSSALILDTKDLAEKTSTEFSLISLGVGAAHTERFKNSSLVVGAKYYNFDLNNTLFKQNINWDKNPRQYQGMINYKQKVGSTGLVKLFADYSGTTLAFNIVNPNKVAQDLLTNTNNNLYVNLNYTGFIAPSWKIFTGLAHNGTREDGKINNDKYFQNDDLFQQKVVLSKFFSSSSILSFGLEQFQSKRNEGYTSLSRAYTDVVSAGFSEAEIYLSNNIMLRAGLRSEYSSYLRKFNLSPRGSLALYLDKSNQFTLSYGKFYQKPDDSFLTQTSEIGFENASNYAVDYEFNKNNRSLRVEAYYKDYNNLVKIVTPLYSGFQAYGPPVFINNFNNLGYGYARGFDLFWRDKKSLKIGEYYVSYSFVDTKRDYIDFPGMATPSYVPKHTINLVARKYLVKLKSQLSTTYTFSSGRTYFNPNNPVFLGDHTQNNQNLSVGISYLPGWYKKFIVINFSANNVLGFNQVYGYRYAYNGERREPILPPNRRGYLLSILVNFGDSTFNH